MKDFSTGAEHRNILFINIGKKIEKVFMIEFMHFQNISFFLLISDTHIILSSINYLI